MAIRTALTDIFDLEYPIVSAPMAEVSGGRLAAAVSNAGALGLVGGGYGAPDWMRRELSLARSEANGPWGVGLITWAVSPKTIDLALEYEPQAIMLSFGDPQPYTSTIKEAGCVLICQVQDLEDARIAREGGADVVIAQGTEAGGHGAIRATLPLVPAVVDAVAPTPVLAAGGIADGRSLAAALMLGAQGVLMGTRFYAAKESLGHHRAKERILAARGNETLRTRVFDVVRGHSWPEPYTGRALRNSFTERWGGREEELAAALDEVTPRFHAAQAKGDFDEAMVWAGEAVDSITDMGAAGELVRRIGTEGEKRLLVVNKLLNRP